tara:strand:+ start:33 stop:314 length:282 start_codon:yes stop_codon:yes gene_type:complete
MSAEKALSIGLIDQVVDEGDLDSALETMIDGLLHNGPGGVAETKVAMNYLSYPAFDDATIDASIDAFAKGRAMESAREGAASFVEKRKPAWAP